MHRLRDVLLYTRGNEEARDIENFIDNRLDNWSVKRQNICVGNNLPLFLSVMLCIDLREEFS